jgi:hypothetical protein
MKEQYVIAIGIWIILLGAVGVFLGTPHGLGISQDSLFYLSAARSLRDGAGYMAMGWNGTVSFLAHFPPIFPLIISFIPEVIQYHLVWLQMVALSVSSYVTYLIALRVLKDPRLALLAQAIVTLSYSMQYIHAHVWTEPLAVMLLLIIVYCAMQYMQPKIAHYYFWLATVLTMIFPLVRYAGLFLLPLAVLLLVIHDYAVANKTYDAKVVMQKMFELLKKRWLQWSLYSIIVALPFIVWQLVVSTQGNTVRSLAWHPITSTKIIQGINTVVHWLIGIEVPGVVDVFIVLLVASLFWWVLSKSKQPVDSAFGVIAAVFVAYITFLVVSISLLDSVTPIDHRILSLVFPLFVILLVSVISQFSQMQQMPWIKTVVLGCWVLISAFGGVAFILDGVENGRQHANTWGENAEILRFAKTFKRENESTVILSNGVEYLYAYGETPSLHLPKKGGSLTTMYDQMATRFSRVCVVYVRGTSEISDNLMTERELVSAQHLKKEDDTGDGALYCFYK